MQLQIPRPSSELSKLRLLEASAANSHRALTYRCKANLFCSLTAGVNVAETQALSTISKPTPTEEIAPQLVELPAETWRKLLQRKESAEGIQKELTSKLSAMESQLSAFGLELKAAMEAKARGTPKEYITVKVDGREVRVAR